MAAEKPVLIVIAGGNGVGKSTFADTIDVRGLGFPYLNPDQVERMYNLSRIAAGKKVIEFVNKRLLSAKGHLAIETTLTGVRATRVLRLAKKLGWEIKLFYLGVEDVSLQLDRIRNRVKKGGHDIPKETVLRRFGRVDKNLIEAIRLSDHATILDNTNTPSPIFHAQNGQIIWKVTKIPNWCQKIIGDLSK